MPQIGYVSSTPVPPLYTWFDPDDDTVPSVLTEGLQKDTLRISPPGQYVERVYNPQTSQDGLVTTNVALSGYSAPNRMMWIDNNSDNVKYYGLKAWIPQTATLNNVMGYTLIVDAVIQCRRLN